ncbi:MAG: hypothetical protein PHY12_05200, partial [Eubacteriales bacterium]|nr:hypothetical protein [Eubacteriales bacterium]
MQWLISLLGLGVLLAVAVLTRARPAPSYRDAPLEDELISHIAALAARLGRGGEGRLRAPRGMLGLFTRQIGFLAQCPADDLLPAARWLSDNGRYLQEMTAALKRELKGMPVLPKTEKGEVRVLCLARELTGHTSAELTQELVLRAAEAWQKSEPLTTAELCALPAALKVALFQVLCEMTLQSAREQRAHNAAAPFARRLLEGRVSARAFEQYKNSTVFLERLFSLLRAGEDQQAIEWLDQHVGERAEIARNELARQTENRLWVGNAITSLRMISRAPWDRLCEQMSLVHQALCEDEVYPRMDEESRAYYREKVAKLARLARKSEQSICELALVLAARPELESVETHVGYYLLDRGVPALLSTLPARDARLRLWMFGSEHAFGLLRLSGWLCFALLLGLVSAIALPWALWLPFALVFLQPFDRCWALLCQRFIRPRLVPRMRVDALKERTLVVCPTLLSDREHALQMIRHLSVLQQANPDPMLHYMLLGDFGDSLTQSASGDEEIIATAATAVQALCDDTQRRFFYLQRNRALSPVEHLYMSRERKRGGLETLLKIVQGQPIEDTFAYCSCPRGELEGKYRYVITLDSDTFLPPGSALRLIGAMSHPLQKRQMAHGKPRGVSVLQPRMEVATHTVGSYLSLLLGGRGGSDSYHLLASDFMQDLAGRGSFVGKGIIDPEPFLQAMEGSILPHMVLSHDLLEGELAGCKSITDVTLYDGEPATLRAFLGRLHRWTRGDWQLLPYLLPLPGYAHSARLDAVAKHKLWMNLRRSLTPVLRFVLMACAVALGRPWLLLLCLWELPWPLTKLGWLTQLTRLALLPCEAFMRADAMA